MKDDCQQSAVNQVIILNFVIYNLVNILTKYRRPALFSAKTLFYLTNKRDGKGWKRETGHN